MRLAGFRCCVAFFGILAQAIRGQGEQSTTSDIVSTTPEPTVHTASLFEQGDLISKFPVECCTIVVGACLLASCMELLLDRWRHHPSKYFQLVFSSVSSECLVISIVIMLLQCVIAMNILISRWVILLNYALMSSVLMVLYFLVMIVACLLLTGLRLTRLREFEMARIDVDPRLSGKEFVFKQCRDRFRESIAHFKLRYYPELRYSDYLRSCMRFVVARLIDFSWKSWTALLIMIVMNGVRSRISTYGASEESELSRQNRTANVGSYIGFVGFGTLCIYALLNWRLQHRVQELATAPISRRGVKDGDPPELKRPSETLFFGSVEATSVSFQVVILLMEWYLAVFGLGMAFEVWREYGWYAFFFYFAAAIPPVILVASMPWTILSITMLASLGKDLKTEEVETLGEAVRLRRDRLGGLSEANALDEWEGEVPLTLHEQAKDRRLDHSVPQSSATIVAMPEPKAAFVTRPKRALFNPAPL